MTTIMLVRLLNPKKRFIVKICKYKVVHMCIMWMMKSYNSTK